MVMPVGGKYYGMGKAHAEYSYYNNYTYTNFFTNSFTNSITLFYYNNVYAINLPQCTC